MFKPNLAKFPIINQLKKAKNRQQLNKRKQIRVKNQSKIKGMHRKLTLKIAIKS